MVKEKKRREERERGKELGSGCVVWRVKRVLESRIILNLRESIRNVIKGFSRLVKHTKEFV